MRKRRVVGTFYGMKYSRKDHKDRKRHKNRIKRIGQAWWVYVSGMNRNIPTTWRRVRRDSHRQVKFCQMLARLKRSNNTTQYYVRISFKIKMTGSRVLVTKQTLVLSDSLSFYDNKILYCKFNTIVYLYIHTTLSYAHTYMSLFLQKLLIHYTTFPAILKLCTTSKRQQAWNIIWYSCPVVNHSALPLNC